MKLDGNLVLELFKVFAPIVQNVIDTHRQQVGDQTAMPTNDQMVAILNHNVDGVLAEGADWKMTHPNA